MPSEDPVIACPQPIILSPPKILHQLIGDPTDVRPWVVEHLKRRDLQEQEPVEDRGMPEEDMP